MSTLPWLQQRSEDRRGAYKALEGSNTQAVGVVTPAAALQGCTQEAGPGEESGK